VSFENIRVVIEQVDGGIYIIIPAKKTTRSLQSIIDKTLQNLPGAVVRQQLTLEEFVQNRIPIEVTNRWELEGIIPVLKTDHDQSRYYRNTWIWDNGIKNDPTKVKAKDDANIREVRDALLAESDADVLPDRGPPSQALIRYRQDLRDIFQQNVAHKDIIWPIKPQET